MLYGITLSWMSQIFGPLAAVLWLIIAFFVGLACSMITASNKKEISGSLLGAAIWVGCEFFRSEIYALHFPWITPGVGFPPNIFSPIVGVYGVSFILIFLAIYLTEQLHERSGKASLKNKLIWLTLPAFISIGFIKFASPEAEISILALQNEKGHYSDKIVQTTTAMNGEQYDVILWPELAIPEKPLERKNTRKRVMEFSKTLDGIFIFGAYSTASTTEKYNSAITLDKDQVLGTHHKNRPVPLFNDGKKGTEAKAFDTPIGRIGTPICFDCDHESIIRRMVADGAQALIVPSLDATSWTKRQHLQHAELFRHRAAENRRWIAVSASSGMTQIIDPYGNQTANLPLIEPGALTGKIGISDTRTIYNRFGWLTGWICMGITALILIHNIYRKLAPRFKKAN